ncbi:MAG TPA: leucine-rich repeat protein, partial [Candidatus Eubacterium faecigallinarum]|nr:leucine-rich repeat protein [Candidatus Eubacterium faecigallinarum]
MKKVLSFLLSAVMLLSITSGLDFSLMAGSYENNDSSIDDSALVMNDTTDTTLSDEDGTGAPQGYSASAGNSATVHFEGARVFSSAQAVSNATVSGSCGDNLTWSLSTDGELVISGSGKMDAFSSYTSVPWYNYISSVETVRINSGVTSISDYAFYNARYLTNVTIPSTVTEIGRMAFAMCSSLTSITLPSSVKEISYALFGDCTKLSSITATGITAIGDYAFQSTALTTFKVGKDVSGISNLAFFKMSKLASFTVDSSNKIFSASNGILYTDSGKTLFAYPAGKTASAFTIPSTVTKIAKCAFTYATNLKTVTIPTSVTTLDESAFQGCGITSVKIPDSVTTVGNFTFYQSDVRTVTFGTGIKETSYEMFEKCENLTTINFPNTELALYSRTFAYCSSLETVNLPSTVTSIGNGCFGECTALTSVTTNGLKNIPFQAFLNCTSLTSLNLNNIENIYRAAFYGCRKLAKVTLPATTQYVHNIAFMQTTELTCKNPDLSKFGYNGLAKLSDISITGSENYTQAYKVLELVNSRRAEAGVGKLVMDESLLDSAMQRAAETAVCFAHTRPDGSTVFEMNSKISGENIAAGQTSAADVMTSWMNSQGHMENILNEDYKTIGIGCFKINGIYFWVQVFGTDANAAEVSKPSDKNVSKTVTVAIDEFSEGTILTGTIFGSVETYEIKFAVDLTSSSIKPSGTSQASVSLINPGFNCKIKVDNTGCQWSSSNTRVATVNKNGLVTGVGHGNSNINLKLGLIAQSKVITVTGSHDYGNGTVTKPATTSSAGTITYTCSCGDIKTETIAKISSAKLSKTSYTYDGNEKNPTVTIKDVVNNVLVNGTDYTLTYDADRTNVGTYNVTITYKGNYSGTDTVSFTVIEQIPERCTPNLSETTYKYDGSEKTPTVTIVDVV